MPLWGYIQEFLKDQFLEVEVLDQRISIFNIFTDIGKEHSKKAPPIKKMWCIYTVKY